METRRGLQSLLRGREIAPVQVQQELQSLEDAAACWLSKLVLGVDTGEHEKH